MREKIHVILGKHKNKIDDVQVCQEAMNKHKD